MAREVPTSRGGPNGARTEELPCRAYRLGAGRPDRPQTVATPETGIISRKSLEPFPLFTGQIRYLTRAGKMALGKL